MLSFFPVVGIGTPPTPHPQASVPPSPGSGGRSTLAGERRVGGEFQFRRGDIHCGTLYIYVLCGEDTKKKRREGGVMECALKVLVVDLPLYEHI